MVTKILWKTRTPLSFQKWGFSNQIILPSGMVELFSGFNFYKLLFCLSRFEFEIYYSNEIISPNTFKK